MTAPLTLVPAVIAGVAGGAFAYSEHADSEKSVALAGGAAAAALGGALVYQENNFYAGVPLILVGLATVLLAAKGR
jgi:ABC-type uncharacterized transport system permease subunit